MLTVVRVCRYLRISCQPWHQHSNECRQCQTFENRVLEHVQTDRLNGILMHEYITQKPKDLEETRVMVKETIKIHNQHRSHDSLKYKASDEVHRTL